MTKFYRVGLTGAHTSHVEVAAESGADAIRAARFLVPNATGTTTVQRVLTEADHAARGRDLIAEAIRRKRRETIDHH